MRIASIVTLLLVLVFGAADTASASTTTWLPQFQKDQHVYVDPALGQHPQPVATNAAYEQQVLATTEKHGLSSYVIITQQGDELTDGDYSNWARRMVRSQIFSRWVQLPGFPTERAVILLVVRSKDGAHVSVAISAGYELNRWGLDRDFFNRSDSPVNKHISAVRRDARAGVIATLDELNTAIDSKKPAPTTSTQVEADEAQQDEGGWPTWLIVLLIVSGTLFVIWIIWLICRAASGGGGGSGGSGGSSGFFFFGGCGGGGGGSCGGGGGSGCGGGGCGGGGGD